MFLDTAFRTRGAIRMGTSLSIDASTANFFPLDSSALPSSSFRAVPSCLALFNPFDFALLQQRATYSICSMPPSTLTSTEHPGRKFFFVHRGPLGGVDSDGSVVVCARHGSNIFRTNCCCEAVARCKRIT